jgi:hypothetical protein
MDTALRRWSRLSAIAGGLVWLLLIPAAPARPPTLALIERLLLLAPLVLLPLALALVAPDGPWQRRIYRAAVLWQAPAALLAAGAIWLPAGALAALLAAGWLLLTGLLGLLGLLRLLARRTLAPAELSIDAGLMLVPVGGIWLVLARYGARPIGFSEPIVTLTAVHFHYAGFAAPILSGMIGRRLAPSGLARRIYSAAALGLLAGVPLVALGISFSRQLEVAAVALLATSMAAIALVALVKVVPGVRRPLARALLAISALAGLMTMALAIIYALGGRAGVVLTIPQMAQLHGGANAFGLALCGLLAWTLEAEPATK